jgi:hypothetical protein
MSAVLRLVVRGSNQGIKYLTLLDLPNVLEFDLSNFDPVPNHTVLEGLQDRPATREYLWVVPFSKVPEQWLSSERLR